MRCLFMIFLIGTLFLVGCNTVERRIQQNQALFDSFPADVQANIKKEKVELGYTKDMVKIALGRPDRIYIRSTAETKNEVWAYTQERSGSGMGMGVIISPHDHYSHGGFFLSQGFSFGGSSETYERLRVEWAKDKVKAIEEVKDE